MSVLSKIVTGTLIIFTMFAPWMIVGSEHSQLSQVSYELNSVYSILNNEIEATSDVVSEFISLEASAVLSWNSGTFAKYGKKVVQNPENDVGALDNRFWVLRMTVMSATVGGAAMKTGQPPFYV